MHYSLSILRQWQQNVVRISLPHLKIYYVFIKQKKKATRHVHCIYRTPMLKRTDLKHDVKVGEQPTEYHIKTTRETKEVVQKNRE